MKNLLVFAALALACAAAQAAKPCDELKAEIASRLDAKGVKGYVLEVVPGDQAGGKKVVGSCDAGARKITYARQ
jgi:hypothetical protein